MRVDTGSAEPGREDEETSDLAAAAGKDSDEGPWKVDAGQEGVDPDGAASKALDLLIEGELKLLAICDIRQASADSRTTALATAAIGLPTLILGLSKSFASNALLLKVGYVAVIVLAAVGALGPRSWNAWRRRHDQPGFHVSSEAVEVADARDDWRKYQRDMAAGDTDPIRVKQLALQMWRTRAIDSRKVAEIKDVLSVIAAVAFALALVVSAGLVWKTRLTP